MLPLLQDYFHTDSNVSQSLSFSNQRPPLES